MEPEQEIKLSPDKMSTSISMRDSGIYVSPHNFAPERQNSDGLVFQFDDIPTSSDFETKGRDYTEEVIEVQPDSLSVSSFATCPGHSSIPHSHIQCQEDQENLSCGINRASRRSFRVHASAVDVVMPFGMQRHTNFTPPRIRSHILDEDIDDFTPLSCLIHQTRSSTIKCDVEKEVGESLRSFSDIFNVESVGLSHGYHVHPYPHCRYNRLFSSSFPGAPLSTLLDRAPWHGVKMRKKSHLAACDLYGSSFS